MLFEFLLLMVKLPLKLPLKLEKRAAKKELIFSEIVVSLSSNN